MKRIKFTETQIVKSIKEHENGRNVHELCRDLGISTAAFYKWRQRYGGMEIKELTKLKALEEENARLKKMYAELAMDNSVLKDVLSKKF